MQTKSLILITLLVFALFVPVYATNETTIDSWTEKAPLQEKRGRLGVAVVKGKIYAIGGDKPNIMGNCLVADFIFGSPLGTNEEYDPETDTWVFKTPMPTLEAILE